MFLELLYLAVTIQQEPYIWPEPVLKTYLEYRTQIRNTCVDYTSFGAQHREVLIQEFATLLDATANFAYVPDHGKSYTENIEAEVLFNTEKAKYTRAAAEAKEVIKTVTCEYIQEHGKV